MVLRVSLRVEAARKVLARVREQDRLRRREYGRLQQRCKAVRAEVRPHLHDRSGAGPESVEHLGWVADPWNLFIDRERQVIGQVGGGGELPGVLEALAAQQA